MGDVEMETGFQLLARLSSRPSIEGLYPILFNEGPYNQQVVEISGYSSSGKTFLITEIIARCILPEYIENHSIEGKNCGVILINTDHHFNISTLVKILSSIIAKFSVICHKMDSTLKEALNNLIVLNCYDSQQFYITFQNLDNILSTNRRVSLVIVDSILAYYWTDRLNGGIKKMDSYQKTILRSLQNITKEHKVVIMYTKTTNIAKEDTIEECKTNPMLGKINYRINLTRSDEKYVANITSENSTVVKYFEINDIIKWL